MTIPLIILAVLATVAGFLGMPAAFGQPHFLSGWLDPVFSTAKHLAGAHGGHGEGGVGLEWALMGVATAGALTMMAVGYVMYKGPVYPLADKLRTGVTRPLYTLMLNKYYVDEIYTFLFVYPGQALAWLLWKFDQYVVDGVVNGVAKIAGGAGLLVNRLQTGFLRNYALAMVLGVILLLAILVGLP